MLEVFGKAYNAPKAEYRDVIIALLFGAFVGTFLVVFEPFDLQDAPYPYMPYSIAFFGVLSFLGVLIMFYLLPKLLPILFNDQHWKVWHQVVLLLLTLLLISTFNGLYINYLGDLDFRWSNYQWMISRTLAVASIPAGIIVLFDYNRKLAKHLKLANSMTLPAPNKRGLDSEIKVSPELITLFDNNQPFEVNQRAIIYLEAEGNYINVFLKEQDTLSKNVIRSSLSKSEKIISLEDIVRCHRSYIVNLSAVKAVTGNAQGLKLQIGNSDQIIPVSRKYIPTIRGFFAHQD